MTVKQLIDILSEKEPNVKVFGAVSRSNVHLDYLDIDYVLDVGGPIPGVQTDDTDEAIVLITMS